MRNMTLTLALNLPAKTEEHAKILTTIYPSPTPPKKTGVQRHIRNNVSVLVVVVPTLFRSCHTITIKSTGFCDLSTV